jgi:DNA-binding NtrC family response regulator
MGKSRYLGRLLIVDDEASTRQYYEALLSKTGYEVDVCEDLRRMQEAMTQVFYDAVLLDLQLGEEFGLDGLPFVLKTAPYTKVFVLTSDATVESAVESMRRGATGYLTKGMPPQKIIEELAARLHPHEPLEELHRAELADIGLVGESEAIRETISMIERLRNVDSTVLILGESGSGKEVVARAIHKTSARAKERFDAINCGAIPESLLESELFGHKKGAFTDAKADRKGIFEVCSDGTLLLDEIGDMPISLQTKLLRVLQERQITPVGSTSPIPINTRVLAATHRDIFDEAKSKRFREDLYYRLSVVVIRIPPLRHRIEDIPILTNHFLEQFNKRFARDVRPPNNEVLARMMAYDWPGNVRELQNAIERAVVFARSDVLSIEDMFQHLNVKAAPAVPGGALDPSVFSLPLTEAKQAFEKAYLEHLLKASGGNISEAARISGRYRADIYRLMHRYGLDQTEYR